MSVRTVVEQGWEIIRLASDELTVDVVPGKGGDILSVVARDGTDVMWRSPWGLRPSAAVPTGGSSHVHALQAYPGGWQTVFPNGGDECEEHGVTWGFHGEAWVAPFDWQPMGPDAVALETRLVRSPFRVHKHVSVSGPTVQVTERVVNEGGVPVEVMWSHHPAFGAPLVGADCVLDTNATRFIVDDARDTSTRDLSLGAEGWWPDVPGRDLRTIDLRQVPGPDECVDRFGYLTDFTGPPYVTLHNQRTGLSARLGWDGALMPHAWYWLESRATSGFPWFQSAYVLAIEPATSFPGQGLATVRRTTGNQLTIGPGESRTANIRLTVAVPSTTRGQT